MAYLLMILFSMLARPQLQRDLSNTATAYPEKTKYMIIGTRQKLFRRVECCSKLKRNVSWDTNFRNVYEKTQHIQHHKPFDNKVKKSKILHQKKM